MRYYIDNMKSVKPWETQDEHFKEDENGRWYVEDEEVYDWWIKYDWALTYLQNNLTADELEEEESYMTGDLNEYIWLAEELQENA